MYNFISLITLLVSCYFLLNALGFKGFVENIIFFFCLLSGHIVIIGYILSAINQLGNVIYWALLGAIVLLINLLILYLNPITRNSLSNSRFKLNSIIQKFKSIKFWFTKELPFFEKLVLTPTIFTVLLVGIINLIVIVFTAPNNWDSMTYHLARVAYFLQHNNINYFGANYWAQVVHPKNSSIMLLYTYLVSGRNENLTQVIQYISYWISVFCIYGISRKAGNNKTQSIFSAMVSALLINWLMEARTTQNDLIITAFLGIIVYSLFAYKESLNRRYLFFSAFAIGLSIGTKANTFLPMLSVAFIALYIFINTFREIQHKKHDFIILAISSLMSICIFAVPAGYLENLNHFGNPFGPQNVREIHTFEGKSINYIFNNGSKNLIRFGLDTISLDGLYPKDPVVKIQRLVRFIPVEIVKVIGLDLESKEASRSTFYFERFPHSNENYSYFGILGFGLVWVMVFLSLFGVIKSINLKFLSIATIIFFISQAYSGPYDPWRGRYFISMAIFAAPIIGPALQSKKKYFQGYLLLIITLGCISALSSVSSATYRELFIIDDQGKQSSSLFSRNRLEHITSEWSEYYGPINKFEQLVPNNATVAVFLYQDSYEYPLFGETLSRTLLPINSFDKGPQPIPLNAQYLLYDLSYSCGSTNDIDLGTDWFLRELTSENRKCP